MQSTILVINLQCCVHQWQHKISGKQQHIVKLEAKEISSKIDTVEICKHYTHIREHETTGVNDPKHTLCSTLWKSYIVLTSLLGHKSYQTGIFHGLRWLAHPDESITGNIAHSGTILLQSVMHPCSSHKQWLKIGLTWWLRTIQLRLQNRLQFCLQWTWPGRTGERHCCQSWHGLGTMHAKNSRFAQNVSAFISWRRWRNLQSTSPLID